MIRVGQCENCEFWYRARDLGATRVTRPRLADREHLTEAAGSIPGLEPPVRIAYFCKECMETLEAPGEEESLIWKPGDPLPERAAAPRNRRRVGAADDAE